MVSHLDKVGCGFKNAAASVIEGVYVTDRKCARVVGEVLGKYHPHGDSAVYEALVRMAQDFSMRAPLVWKHFSVPANAISFGGQSSRVCSFRNSLSLMASVQVSGHGNFGSLDNDPPAAMRYTECRLQAVSSAVMLADLAYDTVDFAPNFDSSQVNNLLPFAESILSTLNMVMCAHAFQSASLGTLLLQARSRA